jgi:hypothetical protein
MPRPGYFTPRKETRSPLYLRQGGSQGLSGRVLKTSPPPGFDPGTAQPLAIRCTDYTILALHTAIKIFSMRDIKAYWGGGVEA